MKIRQKGDAVFLENDKVKVLIADLVNEKETDAKIVITRSDVKLEGKTVINSPGEYEVDDVLVYVLAANDGKTIQYFSVFMEGITFVFVDSDSDAPSEKQLDQIGIDNVLVVKVKEKFTNLQDMVDEFEPEIILPISNNVDEITAMAKAISLTVPEKENFLNLNSTMFENEEENTTRLAVLNN
jgi:hypothetical protein